MRLPSPAATVLAAAALSVGAFVVADEPPLFLVAGVGALAAWGLAFRGVLAGDARR